jgi:hypothetical protein
MLLQMGMAGLVLLQDAPAAVLVRLRVVVAAADTDARLNPTKPAPLPKNITPIVTSTGIAPRRVASQEPLAPMERPLSSARSAADLGIWSRDVSTLCLLPTSHWTTIKIDEEFPITQPVSPPFASHICRARA